MTFNPDDPKWTAYVLGELEDSERAEVESLLESSEEARAYVEELRVATGAIEHELKEFKIGFPPQINAGLATSLTDAQRAAIQAAAGAASTANSTANNVRWFKQPQTHQALLGGVAIAAMILIAIAIPSLWRTQKSDGNTNATVQSAGTLKSEESISPSPAVTSEAVQNPTSTNEIVISSNDKTTPAEQREAPERNVTRTQADENKLTAPPSPQSVQPAPSVALATVTTDNPESAKQEAAPRAAATPPSPAINPPARNNIINDVFPPIIAPGAPRGGAGGGRGGRGGGVGGGNGTGLLTTAQGGTISGTVSDPTHALIPGVTVTATNTESGVATTVLTNDTGAFNFAGLTPGPYRLTAALGGFQTAMLVNINLGPAESQRFNIAMNLSPTQTTVDVSVAESAGLGASAASIGQVLSEQKVRDLPMVGNNVLDLTRVLPGSSQSTVNGLQAGPGGARGGGGGRGGAAAAPPPPPPAAYSGRPIVEYPTTIDGISNYDRRSAPNTANYAPITDNPFRRVSQEPLSTFSSDVDTASYANLRRFITQNQLPPAAAVRIEEMVNYFNYDYAQPSGNNPIGASMEIASAPWNPTHRLVRIGIKARDIDTRRRPPSNLVFLIDVSGSMQPPERLPLIKSGLKMLVGSLSENDHVSIVVYAGASGVVLPSTSGNRRDIINAALDRLEAGGSTNGGAGIQLAYQIAMSSFIPGGTNRVILATDGDFNVGVTNQNELTRLIQERAKSGVFLSVLGVGTDNLKDSTMERLADTGNGNYAYLDSLNEAYKVLVEQMSGTLVTVAKDVKLQVEFNPAVVEAYRLIGYENRLLANADFNNDRKDAGDMGAGHSVTALYEIVPRGGSVPGPDIDPLKYQTPAPTPVAPVRNGSTETLTLKIRYKDPDGTESKLLSLPLNDREGTFSKASADFRFAASVAEFGMILRNSPYRGNATVGEVIENARASRGSDKNGYRQEFIQLVQKARQLRGRE